MKPGTGSDPFADDDDEDEDTGGVSAGDVVGATVESDMGEAGDTDEGEPDAVDETDDTPDTEPGEADTSDDDSGGEEVQEAPADASESSEGDTAAERAGGGSASVGGGEEISRGDLPYVLRRDSAKADRELTQLFLRPEYKNQESAYIAEVAEALDMDEEDVLRFDVREAMYRLALDHPEKVAEILHADGYYLL